MSSFQSYSNSFFRDFFIFCKSKFSADHALSCKIGGYVTLRHNEMRDLTADLLSTV